MIYGVVPPWLDHTPRDWMTERLVPSERLPVFDAPAGTHLRVVATEGGIDDWAAYAHFDSYSAEWVAAHGNKLPVEDAAALFPLFDAKRYRR